MSSIWSGILLLPVCISILNYYKIIQCTNVNGHSYSKSQIPVKVNIYLSTVTPFVFSPNFVQRNNADEYFPWSVDADCFL